MLRFLNKSFFEFFEFRSVNNLMEFFFFWRSTSCRYLFVTSCWWPDFVSVFYPVFHTNQNFYGVNVSVVVFLYVLQAHISSHRPFVRAQAFGLFESTYWRIHLAMPPQSKRAAAAAVRARQNAFKAQERTGGRAGFEGDPVLKCHCFTWQNASLKHLENANSDCGIRTPANTDFRFPRLRSRCGEQQ